MRAYTLEWALQPKSLLNPAAKVWSFPLTLSVPGDDNYVYLAPDGAADGTRIRKRWTEYSDLKKVTVETGMSDGSYILIESDELADGDLIVITKITSARTGWTIKPRRWLWGMGEFRRRRNEFWRLWFEDFDPSNIPDGFPGGFGGNQDNMIKAKTYL